MPTIVEYTDQKLPRNAYPVQIVSPRTTAPCCSSHMVAVGEPQEEGQWLLQYRRCTTCGFTVRLALRAIPDAALLEKLRRTFESSVVRYTE